MHESFGVGLMSGREHHRAIGVPLLGTAEVHISRRQQPEARVVVLVMRCDP